MKENIFFIRWSFVVVVVLCVGDVAMCYFSKW